MMSPSCGPGCAALVAATQSRDQLRRYRLRGCTASGASQMADIEVPVLIVGGSMVGMTAALMLGDHGVPSLVVEHHRGTAIHPRAASVTQRTMEIFRGVGLDEIVHARSGAQFVQDAGVVGVETLAGGATAPYIRNFT